MQEFVCWCCENFIPQDKIIVCKNKLANGICIENATLCWSQDSVCKDFVKRSGLHTNKVLPKEFRE